MPQTPTRTIAKTNRVFLANLSTIDFGPIAYKLMHPEDGGAWNIDCDTLVDQFMDHWPYFGMKDEAERAELNDAFSDTQRLMEAHFGKR